jgi:hypothetical protein
MAATSAIAPLPVSPAASAGRRSGFAGKLGDIALPVILQFIALGRKTGRLTLAQRDAYGRALFRDGRLVFAASPGQRATFGALLVERGFISDEELIAALEEQHRSLDDVPLSEILIRKGLIDPRRFAAVVEERLGSAIGELLSWEACFFRFDVIGDPGQLVDVDGRDFLVERGLAVDSVLVLAAGPGAEPDPPAPGQTRRSEITDTLLGFASSVLRRGALMRVEDEALIGIGRFGGEREADPEPLRLSRREPSVLTEVLDTGETYRGPLESCDGNDALLRGLGGEPPREVLLVPLSVSGRIRFVFYGDNGPAGNPLGAIEPLLMVLVEAAREMEAAAA